MFRRKNSAGRDFMTYMLNFAAEEEKGVTVGFDLDGRVSDEDDELPCILLPLTIIAPLHLRLNREYNLVLGRSRRSGRA